MPTLLRLLTLVLLLVSAAIPAFAQGGQPVLPPVPTPTDIKPGSINCEECPYPYPSKYLDLSVYDQDVRIAYMDTPEFTAAMTRRWTSDGSAAPAWESPSSPPPLEA